MLCKSYRALSYPSRYALRQCILEAKPASLKKEAAPCSTKKSLVRYNQAQNQAAIVAVLVDGTPKYVVAAQYGIYRATIYNWKQQLLGKNGIESMKKKPDAIQPNKNKAELEAEIISLQAQILHLQMERDALQRTTQIFKKKAASI